jgi:4-methyl-5(b-hydroxyethyl)-thiazole monophosphate biosynthesis
MEAVTIIDVLRRAGLEVVTASLDRGVVKGARGVSLLADTTFDDAAKGTYDLIALPGGQPGTDRLKADQRLLSMLRKQEAEGRLSAAVCAAPIVLAEAGLLKGKKAVAFPGSLSAMKLPDLTLIEEKVVEDGNVITSKSAGTAMDFALALVERLCGKEKRQDVETRLHRN